MSLSDHEMTQRLSTLRGWERDGMIIHKTYPMETYMTGLAFASAVGTVCESLGHHPDILIGYQRVTVSFTTHDAGNTLTDNDFNAAEAVERLGYPASPAQSVPQTAPEPDHAVDESFNEPL